MMSTGKKDKIQCPQNVYDILNKKSFQLETREDLVPVKGYDKPLKTFYLNQYSPKDQGSSGFSYLMLQTLGGGFLVIAI